MKMRNPLRKKKNTNREETKSKKLSEELNEIGLFGETDETMVEIKKIGFGYVAQIPLSEIKEMYGNIHEYIKQQHGPGDYQITAQKKKSTSTRRIKVAGGIDDSPQPPSNGPATGINDPSAIAMLLELQRENAQLKAQIDMAQTSNRAGTWEKALELISPFVQTLLTQKGSGSAEAADMLRSTIESVRDLMELSQNIPLAGGSSGEDGGLGTIMNAITMFMQNQQTKQGEPQTPAPIPSRPNFAQPPNGRSSGIEVPSAAPTSPTPTPPPTMPQTDPFDALANMVEQKKEPQEVAEYLLNSIENLDESKIDATLIPIISQMRENPLLAWDSLCQMLPALQEGDYAQNVKKAIENLL